MKHDQQGDWGVLIMNDGVESIWRRSKYNGNIRAGRTHFGFLLKIKIHSKKIITKMN